VPLRELKDSRKVIGTKQVKKALARGEVKKVYVATDAEPFVIEPIIELCRQKQVEIGTAETMKSLGTACGIDVGSAAVALLKE
jgi:large subunit ribosomal protein L7A